MRPTDAKPAEPAVHLVTGDDASLVSQALTALLERLGSSDASGASVVEEFEVTSRDEPLAVGAVLDACSTPPMFSERRIVVVRDAALLGAAEAKALAGYLAEPLATTVLVLAAVTASPSGSRRSVPAALTKAVRSAAGPVHDVSPGTGRARAQWLSDQLASSGLRVDRAAAERLAAHLGEDLGRLDGLLASLGAAYGPGARIGEPELEPFLGSEGASAPWDLTDAIDRGDTAGALEVLTRQLEAGERHPIQVLAALHRHYQAMLRLDGVDGLDESGASSLTGLSPFPARKALTQARRLGHERLVEAIEHLSDADLGLRGLSGLPPALVMEVLVARLARLSRSAVGRSGVGRSGVGRSGVGRSDVGRSSAGPGAGRPAPPRGAPPGPGSRSGSPAAPAGRR